MTKTVLLATAAVLAVGFCGAASAASVPTLVAKGVTAHRISLAPGKGMKTLYSQNDNSGGTGLDSQMFESTYAAYDNQGADDFAVASGTWYVKEVDVTGVYFNGSGPAASENVYFYADSSGLPGSLVQSVMNVKGADNAGSFAIKLGKKGVVKLAAGTYWVSVQANCSFSGGCGEWGWEDRSVQNGNPAAWQNPGGGFGVCPTWGTLESCLGYGPDFMFDIKGKAKK